MMLRFLGLVGWMISTVMAYVLIYMIFDLRDMHPWMRRIAVTLSSAALIARIIRTEMEDFQPDRVWGNTPLKPALLIPILFAVLADIGAPFLMFVGLYIITIDATWIADNWVTLAGSFL